MPLAEAEARTTPSVIAVAPIRARTPLLVMLISDLPSCRRFAVRRMLPSVPEVSRPRRMDERSERLARFLEVPLLIAALLTIPVIVIEQRHAAEPWKSAAEVTNWVIWAAFTF